MRSGRCRSSALVASLCAALALAACSGPPVSVSSVPVRRANRSVDAGAQVQAARLMQKYGLHPSGQPQFAESVLRAPDMMTRPWFESSKAIGLDLSPHVGEKLTCISYVLRERSEADTTVTANFLVARGSVTGAWLELAGFTGGGPALNDHSQFMPPGVFETGHIRLDEVRSVGGDRDPKTIRYMTGLISASKPTSADDVGAEEVGSLMFTHANGAVTDIRVDRPEHGGPLFMMVMHPHPDSSGDLFLTPPPALLRYLDLPSK